MKRLAQAFLFAALLAAVALGLPGEARAQAYTWRLVTVDALAHVGSPTSVRVDANGNPMISYYDYGTNYDLKFAICDRSASANGSCDQTTDWTTATVDPEGERDLSNRSIAVDANGNPMISYPGGYAHRGLRFAICDRAASANVTCDQTGDWTTATVDGTTRAGQYASIAVDVNGNPMISYYDGTVLDDGDLKFAICDRLGSTNGNCDQGGDWSLVTVDTEGDVGYPCTSIAVDASGDPMIAYHHDTNGDLKFAICDRLGSTNGNCDQEGDWTPVTVDAEGDVGDWSSVAVDANGNPMISYRDSTNKDLKFAICDRLGSTNGNCDQEGDWTPVTVDAEVGANVGYSASIAVDVNGDPVISHTNMSKGDLKFATCDLSASTNGNCDQADDWSLETVDAAGYTGFGTSIAVDLNGNLVISYRDDTDADLKFATASRPSPPVGGIAELPDVSESSGRNYIALGVLAVAALVALSAGAWYARRRWLG